MPSGVERAYNIAELRKLAMRRPPAPMFHYIADMALIGAARLSDLNEGMLARIGERWPS